MNRRLLGCLEMGHGVRDYLSQNEIATNAIVAFPAAFAGYCAVLEEAEALAALQARQLRAVTAERDRTLVAMRNAALALAGIALTHADQQNLDGLAAEVRVTEGDFNRARLSQQVRLARQVLAAVRSAGPELAAHGVTEERLADFATKIDAAEAALPATRTARAQKKAATAEFRFVVERMNRTLRNQLDPLLRPLRETNVGFYLGYRNARRVDHRPGPRRNAEAAPSAASIPPGVPTDASAPEVKAA